MGGRRGCGRGGGQMMGTGDTRIQIQVIMQFVETGMIVIRSGSGGVGSSGVTG